MFDTAAELSALTGHDYTTGLSATALSGKKIAVIANTTAPYPAALSDADHARRHDHDGDPRRGHDRAPSIVPYELQRDFKPLQSVIDYNTAHAAEGLKFGQTGLTAAAARDGRRRLRDQPRQGQGGPKAVLDASLAANSAILVPQGNALAGIADRAGYPVLTLPGGYGVRDSSTGARPDRPRPDRRAGSEAELLDDAYAFEQSAKVREVGPPYFVGAAQFRASPARRARPTRACGGASKAAPSTTRTRATRVRIGTPLAAGPVATAVEGDVGGSVPATLSLTLGAPAIVRRVHAGRGEGLHRVDHGQRHPHRR